ncbi:hypothetical protein HU200_012782 [Digitaria exilis]|uniref:Uncharacterized protein n=1 Tax=Digitaria exilis TaxID=1010633 RepID=A0A835FED8_9POAL|nr:hypothetical protein HU200_012782 [Digitaria exilis]
MQATKFLQQPDEIGKLVDPELSNVRTEDLVVLCSVMSRCIDPDHSKRPSMLMAPWNHGLLLQSSAPIGVAAADPPSPAPDLPSPPPDPSSPLTAVEELVVEERQHASHRPASRRRQRCSTPPRAPAQLHAVARCLRCSTPPPHSSMPPRTGMKRRRGGRRLGVGGESEGGCGGGWRRADWRREWPAAAGRKE